MTAAKYSLIVRGSLLIFACALAIRLIVLVEFSHNPFFTYPGLDTHEYDELARGILDGSWSGEMPFARPPLYPMFLALLHTIVGKGFFVLRVAHAILSAANCVLVYLIARSLFKDSIVPYVTAVICCFCGTLIFLDIQLLPTSLDGFLQLLSIALLLAAGRRSGLTCWALAGLFIGLSAINRGAALLFLPVAVLWAYGVARWGWAETDDQAERKSESVADLPPYSLARVIGALLLPAIAVIAPVALHNARYDVMPVPRAFANEVPPSTTLSRLGTGKFVPIASNAGINFYLGNHWELREINDPNHPEHFEFYDQIQMSIDRDHIFSHVEANRFLVGQTLHQIRDRPTDYLKLLGRKVTRLFNGAEIARNSNLYAHRRDSIVLSALLWKSFIAFPSGLLIPLGLLGMWFERGNWRRHFLLLSSLATLAFFILAFFVTARYRAPMLPILAIYSSIALKVLIERVRDGQWARLTSPLVGFLALVLFCNLPVVKIYTLPGEYEYVNLGFQQLHSGKADKAISYFKEGLRSYPESVPIRGAMALARKSHGDYAEAVRLLTEALQRRPDHTATHNDLGLTLLQLGRIEEAEAEFREALRLNPALPEVRANLGSLLVQKGSIKNAVAEFQKALDFNPRCSLAYANLGVAFEISAQWDRAIATYEDLLIVEPGNDQARLRLSVTRAKREAARANSGR